MFSMDHRNGSVGLVIPSLEENLVGQYLCTAENERGRDAKQVSVFGPPPPPERPNFMRSGNDVTISWTAPPSPVDITHYAVEIYRRVSLLAQIINRLHLPPSLQCWE